MTVTVSPDDDPARYAAGRPATDAEIRELLGQYTAAGDADYYAAWQASQQADAEDGLRHPGIPTAPYGVPSMTAEQITAALADTDEDGAP